MSNLPFGTEDADESAAWQADEAFMRPEPTWSKDCDGCGDGTLVERYRGQGDVTCDAGDHSYNAGGQRLRDNWRNNPAWGNEDIDDMEGYEREMLSYEGGDY